MLILSSGNLSKSSSADNTLISDKAAREFTTHPMFVIQLDQILKMN